ncbi:unknown [Prevotella sp. CAG:617]|nr:unknown [Prevotella sp. CAG:617]
MSFRLCFGAGDGRLTGTYCRMVRQHPSNPTMGIHTRCRHSSSVNTSIHTTPARKAGNIRPIQARMPSPSGCTWTLAADTHNNATTASAQPATRRE